MVENDEMDTLEQIEKAENISLVQKYVAQILNEREKEIIVWRYGLNGKKPMTQKKVGEKLGISRYVTWPRTLCSINGVNINGDKLSGSYGVETETFKLDEESSVLSKKTGAITKGNVYRKTKNPIIS